eukprot:Gb_35848 [translate_table: standard]
MQMFMDKLWRSPILVDLSIPNIEHVHSRPMEIVIEGNDSFRRGQGTNVTSTNWLLLKVKGAVFSSGRSKGVAWTHAIAEMTVIKDLAKLNDHWKLNGCRKLNSHWKMNSHREMNNHWANDY